MIDLTLGINIIKEHYILTIIYIWGILYFLPKTLCPATEGDIPSWETPMCLIWFIYFPIKWIWDKITT